jgi:hypothetical protein
MADQRIRPGKTGYWIALLILVLGCGGSGWLLYDGISSLSEGLVRVVVPGETEITLDKTGTWTVFHESPSVVDGQTYNAPIPNSAQISLRSPDGDEIPMSFSVGNYDYDLPGRSGVSIGSFRVDQAGQYTLSAEWPPNVPGGETVLALGHEKGKATVKTVFGIIGILVSGAIASLIFLIVVILRSRSKNRLQEAGVGGSPAV